MPARSKNAPNSPNGGGGRNIVAASMGNLLEWFDFSVYALFAIYIGANFFPRGNPGTDLVKAFLVFGLGFVIRPLGSVVIGIYGDRAGRKAALSATILMMGGGTLLIAIAPSYAAIGVGAPLMLLAGRLLQGFSAGGEIGSAAAFLVEHAPADKKGRFTAWLQASMGMSNILGALVAFAVTAALSSEAMFRWGWRSPFILGLLIVPLGFYLRATLVETPAFSAAAGMTGDDEGRLPILRVFEEALDSLAVAFGISILWAVAVYVLLIYMPVFVQTAFGFSAAQAFGASLIENVAFVAGCFFFGAAADRIGHSRIMLLGAGLLLIAVLPLFLWLESERTVVALRWVLALLGLLVASFTSVAPAVLASLFPTSLRTTGISLAYNSAFTIFGGFAPAILTAFTAAAANSHLAPAWYVVMAAVPAILAIAFMERRGAPGAHLDAVKLPIREG